MLICLFIFTNLEKIYLHKISEALHFTQVYKCTSTSHMRFPLNNFLLSKSFDIYTQVSDNKRKVKFYFGLLHFLVLELCFSWTFFRFFGLQVEPFLLRCLTLKRRFDIQVVII